MVTAISANEFDNLSDSRRSMLFKRLQAKQDKRAEPGTIVGYSQDFIGSRWWTFKNQYDHVPDEYKEHNLSQWSYYESHHHPPGSVKNK